MSVNGPVLTSISRVVIVCVMATLLGAACTQSGSDPEPAETCLEGDPDCEDTLVPANEVPATEPVRGVPVAEAVASRIDGSFEVRGFFFADDAGARMCELLLESFPPQCGGASLPVGDFVLDVPLTTESGVTWSPDVVLLEGEIIGGVFQPLR